MSDQSLFKTVIGVIDFTIVGRLPPSNDLIEGMAELSSA
jgi:hypothetical protein